MGKYKLIVFDFDGTLADSFSVFLEVWKVAAERYGFKSIDEVDGYSLRGRGAQQIVSEIGLPRWKLPFVTRGMRRLMTERVDEVKLFDGVEELLQRLKSEGVQVAIVTTNSRENVERVLGDSGALIDYLGCGASVFGKKSKIHSVIKAAGVSGREVLCVGDEIRDADVAKELGLDFAAVSWGYTREDSLRRIPDVSVCTMISDVLSIAVV